MAARDTDTKKDAKDTTAAQADGTIITDTQPLASAPAPAADPREGNVDAANDAGLNDDPAPRVAAGPEKGELRPTAGNPDGEEQSKDIRRSANSVWCPKCGLSAPLGTDKCPADGTSLK